jgi:hypothetical protein
VVSTRPGRRRAGGGGRPGGGGPRPVCAVLDRIEPSINSLITHVEEHTDYVEPVPTVQVGEHDDEHTTDETHDESEEGE